MCLVSPCSRTQCQTCGTMCSHGQSFVQDADDTHRVNTTQRSGCSAAHQCIQVDRCRYRPCRRADISRDLQQTRLHRHRTCLTAEATRVRQRTCRLTSLTPLDSDLGSGGMSTILDWRCPVGDYPVGCEILLHDVWQQYCFSARHTRTAPARPIKYRNFCPSTSLRCFLLESGCESSSRSFFFALPDQACDTQLV